MRQALITRNTANLPDIPKGLSRDITHSEAYFSQFLKKMEIDIVTLSERFWPYFFFLWLAYSFILIVIRILLQYGETMPGFFNYFGLFYGPTDKATMNLTLRNEQLGNQVIFGILIIEFLVIHYYFSMPNNIEVMPDDKIQSLVKLMMLKVELYDLMPSVTRSEVGLAGSHESRHVQIRGSKTDLIRLDKEYAEKAKELEGENDIEKEEMSKFIRTKAKECDEKTFRGIKFTKENARESFVMQVQDSIMDHLRKSSLGLSDDSPTLRGGLNDIAEFRERTETGFKIDENTVLKNLLLEEHDNELVKENHYTTELPIMLMVSNILPPIPENPDMQKNENTEQIQLHAEEEKPVHVVIHLDQHTTTQMKILYKERNTHIFNMGRMLNSLSYVTGRLMILPLLYSLSEKSRINIIFLFVTAAYVFKFSIGSFENQMRVYMPIFTLVIFLETVYQFFFRIVATKDFFLEYKDTNKEDQFIHSSFYRLWLIAIGCVGYASIIWTSKFVFTHMFIIRQKVSEIFYTYNIDDRKIEVDFSLWRHYNMLTSTLLVNGVYAHLNDIYITCMIGYCLVNSDQRVLLMLMILMFLFNSLMRFKKSYKSTDMDKSTSDKLKLGLRLTVIVLFLIELMAQILMIVTEFKVNIPSYISNIFEKKITGSHYMIIISLLFFDLLNATNYLLEKRSIINYKELHMKYSDICEAQEQNESKLYQRVLIMMANDRLQSQIDRYLKKGIINSFADLNYYKTDIKEKLSQNRYAYLEKYLDSWKLFKLKAIEGLYVTLIKLCNPYVQQDMLYLYTKVCQIDQGILNTTSFNLTEYLSGNYLALDDTYTKIITFYTNLLNKEENEFRLYKHKMNTFEHHADVNIEDDYEICGVQALEQQPGDGGGMATFRASFGAPKTLRNKKKGSINILKRNPSKLSEELLSPDLPSRSSVLGKKCKESFSSAADILSNYLLTKRVNRREGLHNSRNGAVFRIGEENCSLTFHNIKSDSINSTQGYTKLNVLDILQILACLFWSNLETIISLNIILVLFFNGGVMSFLILGILFFRILIEEQGGRILWWEILNIIFFIQFVFKIFSSSKPDKSELSQPFMTSLISILGGQSEVGALRYDAIVQIMVMWLIHFINKKIINLPEGKNAVFTGVSIARFIMGERITNPFLTEINKEKPKMKHAYELVKKHQDETTSTDKKYLSQDNYLESFGKNVVEIEKAEFLFTRVFKRFILITKNDVFKFSTTTIKSFRWRNFATYTRKRGVQYDKTLFKVFMIAIIAILICYPRISASPYNIWEAFSSDEIKDDLFLPLTILISFGCVQIYYMQRLSNDTAGMVGKKYFDNYLKKQKLSVNNESILLPIEKFRRVTKRIISIFKVFKPVVRDKLDYNANPMLKLYIVAITFWAYLSYLVYYRLIIKGHFDQTITETSSKYLCFFNSSKACHNGEAYLFIKALFLIFLMWMLVIVYQIKYGSQVWASSIIEFSPYNSLRFSIYGSLPFLREIMVVLSFATNKTALGLTQWFTIEDIKNTMTKAKFLIKNREKEKFGEAMGTGGKWIFRIAIIIVALLVVTGPMLPFSNLILINDEYPILGASTKIDIVTNRGLSLTRLFNTDLMLKTGTVTPEHTQWQFLTNTEIKNRTEDNRLKFVRMSRYSQTYYEYTANYELEQSITSLLTGGHIRIEIEFITEEEGKYTKIFKIPISGAHAEEIKTVMETNCKSIRLNREMFLENIPMVESSFI